MRIVKNEKDWPTRRGLSQQMNDHLFYAGRSCGAGNCLRQLGLREADVDYVIQQGRPTQKLRLVRNRRHEFLLNMCGVDVGGGENSFVGIAPRPADVVVVGQYGRLGRDGSTGDPCDCATQTGQIVSWLPHGLIIYTECI